MSRLTLAITATLLVVLSAACMPSAAQAQGPALVTTYYPPQPVVGYVPQQSGLLGLRTTYHPVVSYVTPTVTTVARPVVVAPAPAAAYLAPVAPAPVTAYYAPAAPVTTYSVPVAAAPVTTYYAPAAPAPVTTYYAPAPPQPATAYYAPPAPAAPVTVRYAPAPTAYYAPAPAAVPARPGCSCSN